ncbi:hypothetical protein CBR_g50422 [Chara braunii]|uniref:Uncharacterized protein n=1 Tax=Chara braunii TaxID=69332 RepID=A0A388M6Y1_CHABU|nr:hypothetical protein CBR_g50422 [Chara braunii]|eukprot:GBG90243.1 hypothetical protein CBR_g50422 [Chara braunii]
MAGEDDFGEERVEDGDGKVEQMEESDDGKERRREGGDDGGGEVVEDMEVEDEDDDETMTAREDDCGEERVKDGDGKVGLMVEGDDGEERRREGGDDGGGKVVEDMEVEDDDDDGTMTGREDDCGEEQVEDGKGRFKGPVPHPTQKYEVCSSV